MTRFDQVPPRPGPAGPAYLVCPFAVTVDGIDRMLNAELTDDPTYTGVELQAFDDAAHGAGMAVLLTRRDGLVDVYRQPGLRLDRGMYQVQHGVGRWVETAIDPASLDITPGGVVADVRFADADGRAIGVTVDDRGGRRRRPAALLAPFGSAVEHPRSLLLAYMRRFDLVRDTGRPPEIRIAGRLAATGRLPAAWLHRRRLVKYAADIAVVRLNPAGDEALRVVGIGAPGGVSRVADGAVAALFASAGGHRVRLEFSPAFPDLASLEVARRGRWRLGIDGNPRVVSGVWTAARRGDRVQVGLDVTRGWRPVRLPLLMRLMTTIVRVFRTWPTTYRWSATVELGPEPTITSRWARTGGDGDRSYRRTTQPRSADSRETRSRRSS